MTLSSLKYEQEKYIDETRQGIFIYDGDASRFHEWEFRTMMEVNSLADKKELSKAINNIVKALRGEAATIAMDLGVEKQIGRASCRERVCVGENLGGRRCQAADGSNASSCVHEHPSREQRAVQDWPQQERHSVKTAWRTDDELYQQT